MTAPLNVPASMSPAEADTYVRDWLASLPPIPQTVARLCGGYLAPRTERKAAS